MRVADSTALKQYMLGNSSTLSAYLNNSNKVLTQTAFTRASENSVAANKAMKIRKQLSNIEMYDENLNNASSLFTNAETNLYYVASTLYNNANVKLTSVQSTKGDVEFEAIGNEIMQLAEEMVKTMNADTGDRTLFGGTSNNKEPFTYEYYKTTADGDLLYTKLSDEDAANVEYDDVTGYYMLDDNSNHVAVEVQTDDNGNITGYYTLIERDADDDGEYYILNDDDEITELTSSGDDYYLAVDSDDVLEKIDEESGTTSYYVLDEDGNEVSVTTLTDDNGDVITDESGNPIYYQKVDMGDSSTLKGSKAIVYYNGVDVSASTNYKDYPSSEGIYIDIGIGIKYDENGDVVPSTAMDVSLSGAKLTGCGIDTCDDEGDSNNIMQLAFDAARAAYNGDLETCNRLIDKLAAAQETVLTGIAELGIKQNSIEYHLSKDTDYTLNLSEQQNNVEGCDLTEAITEMLAAQAAYNAALQLSEAAVPQSIFNYI